MRGSDLEGWCTGVNASRRKEEEEEERKKKKKRKRGKKKGAGKETRTDNGG